MKLKANFLKTGLGLLTITIGLSSCSKSSEPQTQVPTAAALNSLFNNNLENIKQRATFSAAGTFTFVSSAGTKLIIDGTGLRKNGNPVTGNVDLEYIELYDKGSMAITNKTTMGVDTNGDLVALDSGGEMYTSIKQNGVELTTTTPYTIETPTALTGGTKLGIQPFTGTIDAAGNISWAPALVNEFFVTTNPDKYNVLLKSFNWFNYDKLPATGPRTTISVLVPTEYLNASTVFLSTNAQPNSLGGIMGKWNIGLQCNVIFLAEDNGNFRYSIKPITVVNNQQVMFNISETSIATAAQMKVILNNLP